MASEWWQGPDFRAFSANPHLAEKTSQLELSRHRHLR
jgi:hypothetical protein